jgi:hypothetical protein
MTSPTLIQTFSTLVDGIVELYLESAIKPFLVFHEIFYSKLNQFLRSILDENKDKIPDWFTANFVTYVRTLCVIPTVLLLAWGHVVLPSVIVILCDFGDFFDGVLARFWVDMRKEREEEVLAKKEDSPRPESPADDDSYGKPLEWTYDIFQPPQVLTNFVRLDFFPDRARYDRISTFRLFLGRKSS